MNQEQACYYGLRVGCPNATNPNCQLCADRLARAVNQMLRYATTSNAEVNRCPSVSMDDASTEHNSDLRSTVLSYAREPS